MSKRFNNKLLLGILVALMAIYFGTDLLRGRSRSGTSIPARLIIVDTGSVDGITLTPRGGKAIRFNKTGGQWRVESGGVSSEADQAAVGRMLGELQGISPDRMVSRSSEGWEKYEVESDFFQ